MAETHLWEDSSVFSPQSVSEPPMNPRSKNAFWAGGGGGLLSPWLLPTPSLCFFKLIEYRV